MRKTNKNKSIFNALHRLKGDVRGDLQKYIFAKNNWRYKKISENDLVFFVQLFSPTASLESLNDKFFFEQINKIKKNKITLWKKKILISSLLKFYKSLYVKYNFDFFAESNMISIYHFYWNGFISCLMDNYYFCRFNPKNIPFNYEKLCIWVQGLDKISALRKNQTIIRINLIGLNKEYSNSLLKFLMSGSNNAICFHDRVTGIIKNMLIKIYNAKTSINYPNPNLFKFTCQEAVMIKKTIYSDTNFAEYTLNTRLYWIRSFLKWLEKNKIASFDLLFFEYLRGEDPRKQRIPQKITNVEISILTKAFYEKSNESIVNKMYLTIFLLLILTPFRMGQIMSMKVDCLKPTINPSQWLICQRTKTTHGRKQSYPVGPKIWQPLKQIIEEADFLRKKAELKDYRNYVFVNNTYLGDVRPIQRCEFADYLKKICVENRIKEYTSQDLRSTYMTLCRNYCCKYSKNEFEMQSLTNHSKAETTRKYYVALEIEKMVEASLGYSFEKLDMHDPTTNVVDSIPTQNNKNTVENGCGICSASHCNLKYGLPCLICKNFKTTLEHIPFFEKQIAILKQQQFIVKNKHDVEDIKTKILLYATYLKYMYIKLSELKEGK